MTDRSEILQAAADDEGIRFTRRFPASVERVFAAWTSPEDFSRWFGGPQVEVPLDRLSWDPQSGGDWSAIMVLPDGSEVPWAGSFIEVAAPGRLVYDLTDQTGDRRDIVAVDVGADGEGSIVRFSQLGGTMPGEQYEQAMQGWLGFMDEMEAIVRSPPA